MKDCQELQKLVVTLTEALSIAMAGGGDYLPNEKQQLVKVLTAAKVMIKSFQTEG